MAPLFTQFALQPPGLDYADQRFYASSYGRFNTPDPYAASGGPNDPGSWNRYSYTRGDPANRLDPAGLMDCGDGWVSDASLSGPCKFDQFAVDQSGIDCGDFAFSLTSSCGPYGNGSAGLVFASEDESQEPVYNCEIRLQDTPVIGGKNGAVHSYLSVFDGTQWHFLEGRGAGIRQILPLGSKLNGYDVVAGSTGLIGGDPSHDRVDYDTAKDSSLTPKAICDDAQTLISATDNFPHNKYFYDPTGKLGPNSNSFAHYLLGLVPAFSNIQAPPGAVGWSHQIRVP